MGESACNSLISAGAFSVAALPHLVESGYLQGKRFGTYFGTCLLRA
jgi:hypothetical protein